MPSPPDIVIVGSHAPGLFLKVRRIPAAGETVIGWDFQEPMDGGKGSNQAIAAAKLGARVSFVGCVGHDRIGDEGELWMQSAGVDTSFLFRSQTTASGVGFILLDEAGVPAMVTSMGANAELSQRDIDKALEGLGGGKVLLTQFEIQPDVAVYAAASARKLKMTTIVNPAPAPLEAIHGLDSADILTPNESEAKVLLGMDPDCRVEGSLLAQSLHRQTGAGCVIVTLGGEGAAGYDSQGSWIVRAPVVQVIDTSGAGDAFCAALAARLALGDSVRAASEWACAAAALSVTKPGTIPAYPTAAEVLHFISAQTPP
jgi:ribokinase